MNTFKKYRTKKGAMGFAEIAACSLFIVVLALLGLDICLAIFGASMNDRACRDAARAAAQANDSVKAYQLAQAALKSHNTDGFFVTQPVMTAGPGDFIYQDYGGSPPPDQTPFVTVTTQCTVRVPAPIFFFGAEFLKNGTAQFRQRYTFPVVKSKLLTYGIMQSHHIWCERLLASAQTSRMGEVG